VFEPKDGQFVRWAEAVGANPASKNANSYFGPDVLTISTSNFFVGLGFHRHFLIRLSGKASGPAPRNDRPPSIEYPEAADRPIVPASKVAHNEVLRGRLLECAV
jgi:hypothetical protein